MMARMKYPWNIDNITGEKREIYMKIIMNKHEQPFEASSTMGKRKL